MRISTKALCSSLIAFIINGQDEQKKKKYRKIDDKIANLVANYDSYESENEMEFLKGIASNLHLFQTYLGSCLKTGQHSIFVTIKIKNTRMLDTKPYILMVL